MMNRKMRRQLGITSQHQGNGQQGNKSQQESKIWEIIDKSINRSRLNNFYVDENIKYEMFRDLKDLPIEIAQLIVDKHFESQLEKREFNRQLSIQRVEMHIKGIISQFGEYLDNESHNELYKMGALYFDYELDMIDEKVSMLIKAIADGIILGFQKISITVDLKTKCINTKGIK